MSAGSPCAAFASNWQEALEVAVLVKQVGVGHGNSWNIAPINIPVGYRVGPHLYETRYLRLSAVEKL